jgi:CheY-like chemotaxis protein
MARRCVVYADPTRIQQVLMNLALNARDAMPDGGTLHISLDHVTLKPKDKPPVPELKPGEWICLRVADSGVGIAEADLGHIFEPFFTTKAPGEGTGLGLAQVYGIVSQHDGFIDVRSHIGAGTEVSIYLPALDEDLGGAPAVDTGPLARGRLETVLVVEDSPMTRQALVDSLELLNYRVLTAVNGREALEKLQENSGMIALVLSDVIMPEMSGLALLHEMVERRIEIPVLLLSGHSLGKDVDRLRELGRVELLPKPPTLEQISEAVKRMIKAPG